MSILDPVWNYCERTGPAIFNEPLNVLSNAAFFIAAWLLWRQYQKTRKKFDEERMVLIVLITLIGIGSSLFHMAPNQLTSYGDILPISLFVVFSLYTCLRRLLGFNVRKTLELVVGFGVLTALTTHIPEPYRFNGSVAYFPCLLALALITLTLRQRRHPHAMRFLKITVLFAFSLTFRTVDFMMCPTLSFGTHFLWHICNGVVVYLIANAIDERRSEGRQ